MPRKAPFDKDSVTNISFSCFLLYLNDEEQMNWNYAPVQLQKNQTTNGGFWLP